jgi:hypothetical protein
VSAPRPGSVVAFERVFAAMIVAQAAYVVLSWLAPGGWLDSFSTLSLGRQVYVVASSVSGLLIQAALLYFAAHRASYIARGLIVAFVFLRVFAVVRLLWLHWMSFGLGSGLMLATLVLHFAAIWYLFRPDAERWFRGQGPVDAEVFR